MILDSSVNITIDANNDAVFNILGKNVFSIKVSGIDVSGNFVFSNDHFITASTQDNPNIDELRFSNSYNIDAPLRIYSDNRLGIGKISEKYPRLNENITSFGLDIHNPSLGNIGIRITNDYTTSSYGASMWYDTNGSYINNNGPIIFKNKGVESMRLATNGCVGVYKTDPQYSLHIGTAATYSSKYATYFTYSVGAGSPPSHFYTHAGFYNVSMYVEGHASTGSHLIAFSDRRIKTNIQAIDYSDSLHKLRLLKPINYHYKDTINYSSQKQAGFIAQDVEKILPNTINTNIKYIPNILSEGIFYTDSFNNKIIQFNDFNTSKLERDLSGNLFTKLSIFDENDNEFDSIIITKIISQSSIQIETNVKLTKHVTIYGQYVDNFKLIDYDHLFNIFVSSLKEVDSQLKQERLKSERLQNEINELFTQIINIKSINN